MKHKMLMVALLAVIGSFVYGDYYNPYYLSDDEQTARERQMISDIGRNVNNVMSAYELDNRMYEEAKRGNWQNAYNYSVQVINIIRDGSTDYTTQIINCTYKVQHALLAWNIGRKSEAISMMKEVVSAYQQLDYDSAKNARSLLAAMQNDNIAGKFAVRDVKSAYGGITDIVCGYPMNLATERNNRRHAAFMGMMDAEIGKLEQRQRDIERQAKFDARMEYENNTNRSFDENNPPRSGTYERQEWDYCKRIYDIFR